MTASSLQAKAPEERRRRILTAAVEVLRDKGFAGTRIADIAAAAGTSPALVVYHFKTLDGVLAEALTSVEDEFYDELAAADGTVGAAPADPSERLRLLATLGTENGPNLGDWALWMEVWVRARHDAQTGELRRALDARWRGVLRETVLAGIASGDFRCPDVGSSVLRLAALMDGLAVQLTLRDPEVGPEQMSELWLAAARLELGLEVATPR